MWSAAMQCIGIKESAYITKQFNCHRLAWSANMAALTQCENTQLQGTRHEALVSMNNSEQSIRGSFVYDSWDRHS